MIVVTENAALGTSYAFEAGNTAYGAQATTPLVARITHGTSGEILPLYYAYDNVGNITTEWQGDIDTHYAYDALGQLIQVVSPFEADAEGNPSLWEYDYDRGGNMPEKRRYRYIYKAQGEQVKSDLLERRVYTYGDANRKDKLTAYDGKPITHDAIGNPLTYDGWTYTWQAGRQLSSMAKSGTNASFKYDASGLRTQKTVNGVVTDYTLHGKLVTGLKQGANSLHFFYDKDSRPQMVEYTDANGAKTLYYYAHNLQGDILAILDSNGAKVVEYKYDAWGKPVGDVWILTTAYATLANLNPFRYRGYVYDTETGLYYLRSRPYDPAWGRFVNADSLAGKVGALLGHDMFTYCKGNPVIASDPNGRDPWWGLLSIAIAQLIIKTRGDKFGEKLMAHYFYGNGKKLTISNDTAWNQYLMDNYNFKSEIDRYARTAISSGTNRIDISGKQISLSIDPNDLEEGGYGTGYQLINGSNVNYGGLCVSGVVTQSDSGQYRVNVHYEFHDYMDSGDYSTDVAAVIGSWALVGGCFFYELEISGDVSYDLIY